MRLFVAIDLPEAVKDELLTMRDSFEGVRWVKREQFHLTLRFIGEATLDSIKFALATVSASAFEMQLRGIGKFPETDRRPPRILWVGIAPNPPLLILAASIDAALEAVGITSSEQPFSPHITLARIKSSHVGIAAFFTKHQTYQSKYFPVQSFVLYSSVLDPQGSIYQHEAVFSLKS
jgi:RNA 2',3'-cyclic 3'-phosphodiesterase